MQLPLPADVLVPLGIGVIVAVVAVAALVVGLRRRADESPAPAHSDRPGEDVAIDAPVAQPQSVVRRTVADAIAARRADTDPFPVLHQRVAVMDKDAGADPLAAPLDVDYRDEPVPPPPPVRPPLPGLATAGGHGGVPTSAAGQSGAAEAGAAAGSGGAGSDGVGSDAAESKGAVAGTSSPPPVAAGRSAAAAECAAAAPGAPPAQPAAAGPSIDPESAVAGSPAAGTRPAAPGQPVAQARPDGAPVRGPASTPLAARAGAAEVDSATTPAAAVSPAAPAPWDRAAIQTPAAGPTGGPPDHIASRDLPTSESPDHPRAAPGSPDQNGQAPPVMGGPRPAGSANPFRPARHAAANPDPASAADDAGMPGSTAHGAPDHPAAGTSDPMDPAGETAIPQQSSNAAGSSRNVGAAVAHVLAARAAAPPPGPDRCGDARDRLLAALLDDPRGAVGAVVDLQDCQESMKRLSGALHEERVRLRDVLVRLARSGLRADQLARLSGLADSEVTDLLRRNIH